MAAVAADALFPRGPDELGGRREHQEQQREDQRSWDQVGDEAPRRLAAREEDQHRGRHHHRHEHEGGTADGRQRFARLDRDEGHRACRRTRHARPRPTALETVFFDGADRPENDRHEEQHDQRVGDDLETVDAVEHERLGAAAGDVEQRLSGREGPEHGGVRGAAGTGAPRSPRGVPAQRWTPRGSLRHQSGCAEDGAAGTRGRQHQVSRNRRSRRDAAAARFRFQFGDQAGAAEPVDDPADQTEVHPAHQAGVGPGERVERAVRERQRGPSSRGS